MNQSLSDISLQFASDVNLTTMSHAIRTSVRSSGLFVFFPLQTVHDILLPNKVYPNPLMMFRKSFAGYRIDVKFFVRGEY
ncbi:hypothetical protein N781_14920 [Pontibacillus halophilus JSM 076056 = DSM 19796]|uniref:Uncharacterized protein n=1 Tax=Pontibacillus halophilus JSM 076056 = DSM 19796 TaxID=1385510 RepID=A0A0A5GNN4_9BACI|nr:hypothetical protein N781_14920 [Pontibacillus halophilus JSM 076056 = DSM 19796]